MKDCRTLFEQITIATKGNNLVNSRRRESVSLTPKAIFIGNAANWKFKWKDITNLEVERTNVYFETQEKIIELVNADNAWETFSKALMKRWNTVQDKLATKETVISSTDPIVKRSFNRPTRTYGKSALSRSHRRLLASAAANNWSDEEDDDEKENSAPQLQGKHDEDDQSEQHNGDADGDEGGDAIENDRSVKKRIQTKVLEDEDSDNDLFDDVPMTIPDASHRLVTPHTKAIIDDDDDNAEEVLLQSAPERGQLQVADFFNKYKAGNSKPQITGKTSIKCMARITTPTLPTKPSPAREIQTPIQQDNAAWIEDTQHTTPPKTPTRLSPRTPTKSAAQFSHPIRSISRHFCPLKRSRDNDDIEEFSEDERSHKELCNTIICSARKKFTLRPDMRSQGTADSALALVSPAPRKSPHQLCPASSAAKTPSLVCRWKGLRNLGNTCYLGSSLQLIYTITKFCSGLIGHGGSLCRSISEVAKLMKEATEQSVSPRLVKDAVDSLTDRFSGCEQRDAHEFLSDLIDRVHEELVGEVKGATNAEDQEPSKLLLTDEFFRMNVRVCLKCDCCGYERTMDEMYRHLSIEVDRKEDEESPIWTIGDGLTRFFQAEQRDIKCEKCEEGQTATQTLSVLSRPKALILHLKRFVVREKPRIKRSVRPVESTNCTEVNSQLDPLPPLEMMIQKNRDQVLMEQQLDLDKYLPEEIGNAKYKLSGIIHHHGGTPFSGHYTADAARDDDIVEEWLSFDDGLALARPLNKILRSPISQKTAYILLYSLKN